MSIPSPSDAWRLFDLGSWLRGIGATWFGINFIIYFSALAVLVGIIVAVVVTGRRLRRRGAEPGVVLDVSLWAAVFGVVGGRAFHVLTNFSVYFGDGKNPLSAIYIWEDGKFALYGAIAFGAIGALIGCRINGLKFWSFADAAAPAILIGTGIGRLGDWFDAKAYGVPTDLAWGLSVPTDNASYPLGLPVGTLFQPIFLYELIWCLAGAAVLVLLERKFTRGTRTIRGTRMPVLVAGEYRLQWGKLFALYLVWYGIGRSVLESWRVDPSEDFLGLRTNTWASFVVIVLGIVLFLVQRRRHPGLEPSVYLPGREWEPSSAVHSEDTYSDSDDDNDVVPTKNVIRKRASSGSVTSGAGAKS